MSTQDRVTFYFNPMSRARTVHWMLEEVGAPFDVQLLDFRKGEHKSPAYLKINPMGKLPAIVHRGVVVTEVPAICTYLADAFPQARLAPEVHDPRRGEYYRWLFYTASCFEPAMLDLTHPRTGQPQPSFVGHGRSEDVIRTIEGAVRDGFLLKDRFTTADLVLSSQIAFALWQNWLPASAALKNYVALCQDRPAFQRHLKSVETLGH